MQAKRGDTVHVHYKGSLEDGTVFDSSEGGEPISFTIGAGEVIPGFENAVSGLSAGEKTRAEITPENGYGERSQNLVFQVSRSDMPEEDIDVGDVLRIGFPDGNSAQVQVAAMDDETVTLDANHPLAGKTLIFDLELVKIA